MPDHYETVKEQIFNLNVKVLISPLPMCEQDFHLILLTITRNTNVCVQVSYGHCPNTTKIRIFQVLIILNSNLLNQIEGTYIMYLQFYF